MSKGQENKAVIRTPDRRLRVFVSSAPGELADERRTVSRAISALRLTRPPDVLEQPEHSPSVVISVVPTISLAPA